MIVVAMDPKDVRKVAAFAEAIRDVETRFGFRLESHSEGLLVAGDAAPLNAPYVLVRVPATEDLAVGIRSEALPSDHPVREVRDGTGRKVRDVCLIPGCGCDGEAHA